MRQAQEGSKLLELRAKTDRQLIQLVNRMLDRGISWASDGRFGEAEQACFDSAQLLPAIRSHDRWRVEEKLADLRDRVCGRMEAAC